MSKDYLTAIRLDVKDDFDGELLIKFLQGENLPCVVYEEISDKVNKLHYQGYIKCGDKNNYAALKKKFKDTFGKSHNRYQRSFTPVRKQEEYMRYVAKDKKLFFTQLIDESHIRKCEEESYKKEDKKKKSQRLGQIICDAAYHYFIEEIRKEKPSLSDLFKFTIKFFGGEYKCFDMPHIKKYTYLLSYHFYGDKFIEEFAEKGLRQMEGEINITKLFS